MHWPRLIRLLTAVLVLTSITPAPADVTKAEVNDAIDRSIKFLRNRQGNDGRWARGAARQWEGGDTALVALALLNSNVPLDDPMLQKAMVFVRNMKTQWNYAVALQTMVLCTAEPKRDMLTIRENVRWIERTQINEGFGRGGWSYGSREARGSDPSNSQFAMLALFEAEQVGVEVNEQTWRRALNYWKNSQRKNGSWGYQPSETTGSMTCAGIASVLIANMQIGDGDANVDGENVQCCQPHTVDDSVARGLQWLGDHFSVRRNPGAVTESGWLLYYLYALERTGRLSGQRFIGNHDWYREGAEFLIQRQGPLGEWKGSYTSAEHVGTALALLFLSKGRRPVLIGKAQRKPDDDWNYHRQDLTQLTHHVEGRWSQKLTWQTIDMSVATAEDLAQIPVLYLSGQESLKFSQQQKKHLKQYIAQGGFIFAESCCNDGGGFDRDFRALVAELFPDSELRLLPQDHPVWYAEQKVNPKFMRPLLGVDACCRTSVIYCPERLSCFWELAGTRKQKEFVKSVQDEIEACLAIGANVVTYATQRELRDKLDIPNLVSIVAKPNDVERGSLQVAKLFHNGGSDDAPAALTNLLKSARQQVQLPIETQKIVLPVTHPSLADYPIAFMHGRRQFRWTDDERKALATYLENGGFLVVDSICASKEFAESFRSEMQAIFPDRPLERLRPSHPIFTESYYGHDITKVSLRNPESRRDQDRLTARLEKV
ncbi:MAG: DUF4159 domain-containing protein, partial [Planctomycetales bacterium]|nr:DUF4159 domain-containing protein [Planctomycetales bacterium]